jgi:hypothetical protein
MSRPQLWHGEGQEWIPHCTRSRPVSSDTIVQVQFGFAVSKHDYEAGKLNWAGFNDETRIVAYRVVGAA